MPISIQTLGGLRVTRDGEDLTQPTAQPLRMGLLAYIAAEGAVARRDLTDLFWPGTDPERSRRALNQALYVLRQMVGEGVLVTAGEMLDVADDVDVDVRRCDDALRRRVDATALRLYQGPFLAGWPPPKHREFQAWMERRSSQLARGIRVVRKRVTSHLLREGDAASAKALAERWLIEEPLDDEAHHALIHARYLLGDRAGALKHFELYRSLLRAELDVEPLEATYDLVKTIRASTASSVMDVPPTGVDESSREQAGRPTRPRRRWGVGAATVTVAVVALVAWVLRVVLGPQSIEVPGSASEMPPNRIAVLYFDDVSPGGAVDGLAQGLTYELIDRLSSVAGIEVISPNGIRPFITAASNSVAGDSLSRRAILPLDSVARILAVGTMVTGSVQVDRGRVSAKAHLVDPVTAVQGVNFRVDGPLTDLFDLLDDLASQLETGLRVRLGQELKLRRVQRSAPNTAAWLDLQLVEDLAAPYWLAHGREAIHLGSSPEERLGRARALAEHLVESHPGWPDGHRAAAQVELARAKAFPGNTAGSLRAIDLGIRHARTAATLDSKDARSWVILGTLRWQRAQLVADSAEAQAIARRAEQDLRKAVAIDPSQAEGWSTLSQLRLNQGDAKEAATLARRALEVDTWLADAADIRHRHYLAAFELRQFRESHRWCLDGFRHHPEDHRFLTCQLTLPGIAGVPGLSPDSALHLLEWMNRVDPEPGSGPADYRFPFRRMLYAMVLQRNGEGARARAIRDSVWLETRSDSTLLNSFYWDDAVLAQIRGDTVGTIRALQEFLRRRPWLAEYVRSSQLWNGIRERSEFQRLFR